MPKYRCIVEFDTDRNLTEEEIQLLETDVVLQIVEPLGDEEDFGRSKHAQYSTSNVVSTFLSL